MSRERDGGEDPPSRWRTGAAEEIRAALDRAGRLLTSLDSSLGGALGQNASASQRIAHLEQRMQCLEHDRHDLSARLAEAEVVSNRLLGLYAAASQLHATLDPEQVLTTLAEITVNLVGADGFVLLLRDHEGALEPALEQHVPAWFAARLEDGTYRGGDALVDACLRDGALRLAETPPAGALGAVPLRLQGEIVGALAILHLLDHREPLGEPDRELLELLSIHAATALLAAHLHDQLNAAHALDGLVELVRGGARR